MAETPPTSPHDDLVRRLFYLLTGRFKDGAAVEGQAKNLKPDTQVAPANRLRAIAEEAIILMDAVIALAALLQERRIRVWFERIRQRR